MSTAEPLENERIGVVVLNYNNAEDSIRCLDCLMGADLSIFLVDNSSTDDSQDVLQKYVDENKARNVMFLRNEFNLGYAGGNNAGIRAALDADCSYICILNNDTLLDPLALYGLAGFLADNQECGFVGPVLLEDDGTLDTVQSAGARIDLWTGRTPPNHRGESFQMVEGRIRCDYIGGACMMFRASDIDRLGFIPEEYFLFFEETEWCLRASRTGLASYCCTDYAIVHRGSASIKQQRGLAEYLLARNRIRFVMRNGNVLQVAACFACYTVRSIVREMADRDGSIRCVGYMIDGIRDVFREPYKSFIA